MTTLTPPHPSKVDRAPVLSDGTCALLGLVVTPAHTTRVEYVGHVTDYETHDDGYVYVTWLHTGTESPWPRQALRAATAREIDALT